MPLLQGGNATCRHIDLKGMPDIYIFYCNGCQHVETVKEERVA